MRDSSPDKLDLKSSVQLLISTLNNWPWRQTVQSLRLRFREGHLGLTAGSLTFTTLISLVPLLTVMLALFTAFPIFSSFQSALEQYFVKSLIPANIAKPVLGALTQFASKANRLGAAGLVFLGFSALALMLTIDRTLNSIWRVQRPRPMAQRVLVYWASLTLGPLLLGGSLALTSYAVTTGHGLFRNVPFSVSVLFSGIEFLLLSGGVAALFHYVPNTVVRWRHALAGGVFVAVGFNFAKSVLAWYFKSVPTFSTLYGAFATVPIFLVWLYAGWVIVLLGALLAANAPSLSSGMLRRPDVPGLPLELSLGVLRELRLSQQLGEGGVSSLGLAQRLRIDPLQLEPVLDQLGDLDLIARLEESGAQRLVLLVVPGQTPAAPLLNACLAQRSPALLPLWQRSDWEKLSLAHLLGV
ncbi:YihY family inner membrane protein [Roseateles sp.]|uniref:YihY family inner membrane protein n=1 Tax=Roseateles sp. TaxID=1971397 RepID=UPI00286ACF7A|nr:YihY family inner membrane protein [Roseateles sp.]